MEKTRRQHILDTMSDAVMNIMYYDRKEDEDLGRGEIEEAVKQGEITPEEMIEVFTKELMTNFPK